MSKRVRISNESLNSYGTWVQTSGMDIEQYGKNPVLLYMHERGKVIGYVKDLRVEGDEITGEPVFDEASELSKQCKKQWEVGSLRMVSIGIDIKETSDDAKYLKPGQTAATITRSKLFEVSVVDIGANDDAIALHKDGVRLTLGKNAAEVLPLLRNTGGGTALHSDDNKRGGTALHSDSNNPIKNKEKEMDLEKLALELGLPKDAGEAAILAKVSELKNQATTAAALQTECDTLKAARIESMVDAAIAEKKIGEGKKQHFMELGKKVGADTLQETLEAMSPQVKISTLLSHAGSDGHGASVEIKKLSDLSEEQLLKLRKENPAEYKKLYKAEYGMECEL